MRRPGRALSWTFLGALLLVCLNLRAPFVTVAPTTSYLRDGLDVGSGAVGVLTSLPVLCFGLLAPLGLLASRRYGPDLAVVLCLSGVVLGSLVRSAGGYPAAIVGTLLIGVGITIGNIVVPVLIRRDAPPATVGAVTGAYVSTMNVGSVAVSVGAAPLAAAAGWQAALLAPAVVAVVAGVVWSLRMRRHAAARAAAPDDDAPAVTAPVPDDAAAGPALWRRPISWLLALAFCAQSSSYYGTTAWLPSYLQDDLGLGAAAAGTASSVFQLFGIVGALGVPLLALRVPGWATVVLVGLMWVAFPLQLVLLPDAFVAGSVIGGIAQGGGLAALFTVIVQVARTQREGEGLSTLVQGVGYVVAAAVPTLLGVVHDAAGTWTPALLVIVGTTSAFLVLGTTASIVARRVQPAPV